MGGWAQPNTGRRARSGPKGRCSAATEPGPNTAHHEICCTKRRRGPVRAPRVPHVGRQPPLALISHLSTTGSASRQGPGWGAASSSSELSSKARGRWYWQQHLDFFRPSSSLSTTSSEKRTRRRLRAGNSFSVRCVGAAPTTSVDVDAVADADEAAALIWWLSCSRRLAALLFTWWRQRLGGRLHSLAARSVKAKERFRLRGIKRPD